MSSVHRLFDRYDPENSLIPNGPLVTWSDMELAHAVLELQTGVAMLTDRVTALEKSVDNAIKAINELEHLATQVLGYERSQ